MLRRLRFEDALDWAVMGFLVVLAVFAVMLLLGAVFGSGGAVTSEVVHELADGRSVVCVVGPQGGLSCDWVNAR